MATFEGNRNLEETDNELFSILRDEDQRQASGVSLIASENFTSKAVLDATGSMLTNKYAEGYPGRRYYGGNEFVDKVELLCISRALETFGLSPDNWACNCQPLSGSSANLAVYNALLKPHDRIMGLDLASGGHLTHGFYTPKRKVSSTSVFWESLPYRVDQSTGLIDYTDLEEMAIRYCPKLIICGGSAYSRDWDFKRFRQIADRVGAMLMCDMAHISGLVATRECNNPFEVCDVVTTTTHKTLRGPRSGLIFSRRGDILGKDGKPTGQKLDYEERINFSVFPATQGGPHMNTIAGVATALKEAQTPEFKTYIQQVKKNISSLAEDLKAKGYTIVTGGTDNHLLLWDVRPQGLTGSKVEEVCNACHLYVNKNTVPGDKSALSPGGVRIGSPCMTSRNLTEKDFSQIADFLDRCCKLALKLQEEYGKRLVDFRKGLGSDDITALRKEVNEFASKFPLPGYHF
mmetsp:Transcript_8574/g.24200  ORF Transcript_8574/g.24200 Transcript_8574/m.24200 type:complete len:461 (-) Transcript_8574:36-1418(-)